jgi:hypothetical protein
VTTRSCGPCQACCAAKEIPAAASPPWTPCQHQCSAGCAIYDRRPAGCAAYTCAWVDGWGREREDRPDRLGVLFEMAPGPVGGLEVRAIEVRAGALEGVEAQARLESWATSGVRLTLLRQGAPTP